ncbi:MAG TPA: DNA recombination protein RmuC [Frankiaceae bacterium]|nr:DNA recombination protein RmuC [Frankiaceae bacterium]
MSVLLLLIGLAAGAVAGLAVGRARASAAGDAAVAAARAELAAARGELDATRAAAAETASREAALASELSAARTALEYERAAAAEQVALLRRDEAALKDTLEAMMARYVDQGGRRLLDLAEERFRTQATQADGELAKREQAVAALVAPIREGLAKVDAHARDLEAKREGAYRQLTEQVAQVQRLSDQLRTETASLVTALRKPQARGQWGEMQLRRAVELAGMVERCDFDEQVTVNGADGASRPDLVVHLPGGRHVVVDSKCPLDGFLETVDCADEATRRVALQRHARHVRTHIDALSKKRYGEKVDDATDFVVLFLPGEALLSAALDGANDLLEYGAERSVIVSTPTTLIALLRSVAFGWRQEALARDAREIADLGRTVYERLSTMGGHFAKLGRSLKSSVDAYNTTIASLESRVLPAARRFEQYRLADDALATPAQIEAAPTQLQATELVESAAEARPVAVVAPGATAEPLLDEETLRVAGLA